MEWVLALLAGGGASFAAWKLGARRATHRQQAEELEGVRRLAEEDVTVLGEQLARLDGELAGRELDEAGRLDYQTALDAYEQAKWVAPRLRKSDEISTLTDTLSLARYAIVCVMARAEGRPVPERRVPCFFNPQHGPSTRDVVWTPPRHGTRTVPACAQCAARVAAREKPEVRTVRIGSRNVPYWEAGVSYLPYTEGYFAGGAAIAVGASVAWAFSPVTDAAAGHGFAPGDLSGGSSGTDHVGFDGGGFDGGGVGGF